MTRIGVLLLSALASHPSQSPAPAPAPPPRSDPATATAVLKVPGMDRVRVVADVVYSKPDGTPLAADVYLPAQGRAGSRPPAVILVAGGAENPKAWGVYTSLGRLLAPRESRPSPSTTACVIPAASTRKGRLTFSRC